MDKLWDIIQANKPVFSTFLVYSLVLFGASLGAFFLVRSDAVTGAQGCALRLWSSAATLATTQPALTPTRPTASHNCAAYFELSPFGRDTASAAAAVVVSYSIIGVYSYHAMAEELAEEAASKRK